MNFKKMFEIKVMENVLSNKKYFKLHRVSHMRNSYEVTRGFTHSKKSHVCSA